MSELSEFIELCVSNLTKEDLTRMIAKVNDEGQVYLLIKPE